MKQDSSTTTPTETEETVFHFWLSNRNSLESHLHRPIIGIVKLEETHLNEPNLKTIRLLC